MSFSNSAASEALVSLGLIGAGADEVLGTGPAGTTTPAVLVLGCALLVLGTGLASTEGFTVTCLACCKD